MKQYQIRKIDGFREQDIFESGCQPDTGSNWNEDINFSADTIPDLVKYVKDYFDFELYNAGITFGECEPDRIDVQRMECEDSTYASNSDIEAWKQGKKKLYLAYYILHVEQVEPVNLEDYYI